MSQQGWISLYRKIQDSWLWEDKPFSKGQAWIDLILLASHEEKKVLVGNELIKLERGSLITSETKLAERWGWSRKKVHDFLKLLECEQTITLETNNKRTAINIVNYSVYQDLRNSKRTAKEQQKSSEGTAKEQQKNTNNNVNNDNNDNKKINNYINNTCVHDDSPAEKSPEVGDGAQDDEAKAGSPGKGETYTQEFETFWSHYPRHKEKKKAYRVWQTRLKEKYKPEDIIKAAINYAEYCKLNNLEERYIKLAATFLGPDKPFEEFINWQNSGSGAVAKVNAPRNYFNSYGGQRKYDIKELEKMLLSRRG
ncbi:hypothetical protein Q3V94_02640 [Caloramator sp. CAR-1]|uniref:hypothetical protein n=1 Tax=Caloramator sp. CAR-1 TaxID=3062777 RepID=UPI0026E13A3B|nr:hypothetical protein [Caloramator sp. CAR-1]MDO6353982.1 hypothetical protein [Caloramator sp. CAR-1]